MTQKKVALVTGSTSGIGAGIAERLAAAGYNIIINGLGDQEHIDNTANTLAQRYDVEVVYQDADMTQPEAIQAMIKNIEAHFGRIDVLVNNAGIQHVESIETFPTAQWDRIIAINLSSAFHTIQGVFSMMKAQKFGRIINMASAHALVASPYKSAYVAAKHGILGLTKVVAMEGARENITCNAVCPGYVKTPLVDSQISATAKARGITEAEVVNDVMLGEQPTKSFVTIDQVADLVLFLAQENSGSITGAALPIDGGWTAH